MNNDKDLATLNDFICNIDCLDDLYDYTKEANIFTILKSDFFEIRHSNMLAWLLNPNENHGFEDKFLKKVLFKATSDNTNALSPYNIELMDFSDAVVYREKDHIDILIVSDKNQIAVAIENKVKSSEHDDQLNRYFGTLKKQFADYDFVLIYLTPDGDDASNSCWVSMSYDFIQGQLDSLLKNCKIPEKNKVYISDYITTIRRNIVGDEKLKEICTKIYNRHKAALDLIYENKPNIKTAMFDKIKEYLKSLQTEYDFTLWFESSTKWIRFIPNRLNALCKDKGDGTWTPENYILTFEVEIPENGAWIMKIMLGPTREEFAYLKQKFLDIAIANNNIFNIKGNVKPAKWIRIDSFTLTKSIDELMEKNDMETAFKEIIAKKIKTYLNEMSKKVDLLLTAEA